LSTLGATIENTWAEHIPSSTTISRTTYDIVARSSVLSWADRIW